MKPKSGKARRALFILFIIYCAAMLLLLFARSSRYVGGSYIEQLKMNLNLVPLDTVRRFIYVIKHNPNPHMLRYAHLNLGGNVAAFIPFGFFLPCLFDRQRRFRRFFLTDAAVIVCIELLQLVTLRGSCDIDDLILNLIGSALGYAVWKLFDTRKSKKS